MRRPGPPVLPILLLAAYRSGVFRKKSIGASQRGRQRVSQGFLGASEARYANGSLDERGVGVGGRGEGRQAC
jgi:hypothetical protein